MISILFYSSNNLSTISQNHTLFANALSLTRVIQVAPVALTVLDIAR